MTFVTPTGRMGHDGIRFARDQVVRVRPVGVHTGPSFPGPEV
jgi:hypothetical protein